jgi:hypothetical protein
MPILIAGAGAFVLWAVRERRSSAVAAAVVVFLSGSILLLLAAATRMTFPELARGLRFLGIVCEIGAPFAYAAFASRKRRVVAALGWAFLALAGLAGAHELRSRTWHETELRLGRGISEIQQSIALSPSGLDRLRKAPEVFLVMDLRIPDGSARGITVIVNGREFASEALVPTIPRFGESTAAGGRDRRAYRQWWAIPLPPESLTPSMEVALRSSGRTPITVYGDRYQGQEGWYEGPSFGDWPHLAAVKLEYDGDYRLPIRRRLET